MSGKTKERRGNIEIRLHGDGTVDEILIYDSKDTVLFHMEAMDEVTYWMRAYGQDTEEEDGQDLVVHVWAEIGELPEDDMIDRKAGPGPKVNSNYEWD